MSTTPDLPASWRPAASTGSILYSRAARRRRRLAALAGHGVPLTIASSSALAVLFIFFFILKDAIPFFRARGFVEFFTGF